MTKRVMAPSRSKRSSIEGCSVRMRPSEAVIGEERRVEVTGYSGRTVATVMVVSYERAQRVQRALRGLATWWGAALVSVLIPIAHFVLVPSFFLYGVYTFARRLTA